MLVVRHGSKNILKNKMTKARLTKLISDPNNLRTESIEGVFFYKPAVNRPFVLIAEPSDERQDARIIRTSPIKVMRRVDRGLEFDTQNSTYLLEIIYYDD